jgi:uroporphyrin-3 C-methyltransferase
MNETTHKIEPDTNAKPQMPAHKNPIASAISHLNLTQLTLAVLVIIFVWQWLDSKQQLNQIQRTLAERLAEVEGSNKANLTLTHQSQELARELGGKLSVLESKFAETQSQRTALEALYQDLSSNRDQMVLAEVEQLLLIAGQQLQLAGNVRAALIAMQQADNRLQRLDRPALNSLRRATSNDINKLRALPEVDVSVITARLDSLILLIDRLPLIQDASLKRPAQVPPVVTAEGPVNRFFHDIWFELKSLVRITNTHNDNLPLLSPTQSFFLRENLKLRLLSARFALLSRDENSFKYDIKTAQEWVRLYFDNKTGDGVQVINGLQKLNASNIRIEIPDVSGSLDAVRHYRATHEKNTR